jgi:hypothetical protein
MNDKIFKVAEIHKSCLLENAWEMKTIGVLKF